MYQAPTAPLSIGQSLDEGFRLFKAGFSSVIVLSLIANFLAIPFNVLSARAEIDPSTANAGLLVVAALITFIGGLVISGALIARIGGVATGRPIGFGEALAIGLRRGGPLFLASFLFGIAAMVGTLLLVLPGVYIMVALFFYFYAVVLDRKGPVASLSYSREIVRGNWWRTAGILTIIVIILVCAYFLIVLIFGIAFIVDPDANLTNPGPLVTVTENVIYPLVNAVFAPLSYAMFMVVYSDLKLRREGTDLADRIAAATG